MGVGGSIIYIYRGRELLFRFGVSGVNRAASLILFHS